MGENLTLFKSEFNSSLRVEARREKLSSEAGVVVLREILERSGMMRWLDERLVDARRPDLVTHPLAELVRTSLLLLGQGWRDQDDADTMRDDPLLRLCVSGRRGLSPLAQRSAEQRRAQRNPPAPDGLPSQPTLSRLMRMLSSDGNRATLRSALVEMSGRRLRASRDGHRQRRLTIDVDSLPIEVHGHQPGSEHNGHFHARVYHPLVATCAETGDLLDLVLRHGAAHTAEGALDFLLPLLDQVESSLCQVAAVRIDAGFPEEKLLSALEARRTRYVARLRNNPVLDRMAVPYLRRPAGRPPSEPRTWLFEHRYRAQSWSRDRRLVLVVQEQPDELLLHHFWLVTSFSPDEQCSDELLEHYRQRGTAEGHFGELIGVMRPALSSSPRQKTHYRERIPSDEYPAGNAFAINEVVLLLNAIAYNLVHAARCLVEASTRRGWSLQRVRERLLRVAARVLVHGRRAVVVIAPAAASLWSALWAALGRQRVAPS